jgi:hypothetical protein
MIAYIIFVDLYNFYISLEQRFGFHSWPRRWRLYRLMYPSVKDIPGHEVVTCRKVRGLITDGGHSNWNFSCRTVAPGSTQPLKEKYQQYLLEGMGSRCVSLTTLPPLCGECLEILGASDSWRPKGLSRPVCVPCGQTDGRKDRHYEANCHLLPFYESARKFSVTLHGSYIPNSTNLT